MICLTAVTWFSDIHMVLKVNDTYCLWRCLWNNTIQNTEYSCFLLYIMIRCRFSCVHGICMSNAFYSILFPNYSKVPKIYFLCLFLTRFQLHFTMAGRRQLSACTLQEYSKLVGWMETNKHMLIHYSLTSHPVSFTHRQIPKGLPPTHSVTYHRWGTHYPLPVPVSPCHTCYDLFLLYCRFQQGPMGPSPGAQSMHHSAVSCHLIISSSFLPFCQ